MGCCGAEEGQNGEDGLRWSRPGEGTRGEGGRGTMIHRVTRVQTLGKQGIRDREYGEIEGKPAVCGEFGVSRRKKDWLDEQGAWFRMYGSMEDLEYEIGAIERRTTITIAVFPS